MTRRPMPEITDETRLCTSSGDLDPGTIFRLADHDVDAVDWDGMT